MNRAEVTINAKGITSMPLDVFAELDHGAICKALGIRVISPEHPKRSKNRRRK